MVIIANQNYMFRPIAAIFRFLQLQASQAKGLTGGGDLHEAQVDVPLSVSHSCVWPHCWAL